MLLKTRIGGILMLFVFLICVIPAAAQNNSQIAKISALLKEAKNSNTNLLNEEKMKRYSLALNEEKKLLKPDSIQIELHEQFASFLNSIGAYSGSIEHSKLALKYQRLYPLKKSGRIYYIIASIASGYLLQKKWDSCEMYYRQAMDESYQVSNIYSKSAAHNNLGIYFKQTLKLDSAIFHFNKSKAFLLSQKNKDSNLLIGINDNIAECSILLGKHAAARQIYLENITLSKLAVRPFRVAQATVGALETFLLEKNTEAATDLIEQSSQQLMTIKNHKRFGELNLKFQWLKLEYYVLKNEAYNAEKQIIEIRKLLESNDIKKNLELDQSMYAFMNANVGNLEEELELKSKLVKAQQQKSTLFGWIALLSVLVFLALGGFFYVQNKRRLAAKQTEIEIAQLQNEVQELDLKNRKLENDRLQLELNQKQQDLTQTALLSIQEFKIKEELLVKLKSIAALESDNMITALQQYIRQLQALVVNDEKTKVALENIDTVNEQFFDKLKTLFPTLSKNELELCGMIKVNLNNKEIASIKTISYESVKMARNRLKKKMGLTAEERLSEFIGKIG